MFEISTKKVDFEKDNTLIKKNINLDNNLDCFILIDTDNANFWDLILNNILDFTIDKISKQNAYNDFSIALENINAFVKKWEIDSEKKSKLDIIIWILNDNNYIFSNIWKSSCYLINNNSEVIELTNKEENKREFNYVSSWNLSNNEIIVSCTKRLLNYLSKSDLVDWLILSEDINIFNKNIKNILQSEILDENISISSLKYLSEWKEEEINKIDVIKDNLIKSLDNKFSKNLIWHLLVLKDKINESWKLIKNGIFIIWIAIWVFLLYSTLSTVISISTQNEEKQQSKENIIKAKTFLRVASENVWNEDIFELNIKYAEDLLTDIESKQIFLNDIAKINDEINILKKQFNKIEIFEPTVENIIYTENFEKPVKLLKNDSKITYVVNEKWVVWPIIPNSKAKNYIFSSLEDKEVFIDAVFMWDTIYLLTNLSKVVKFTKNWYFNYMDVAWQKTWQKSKKIATFGQNIYLIWEENNQIYKHSLSWNNFKAGEWYLKDEDLTQIWEILSLTIDWWFFILKKDLSVVKFFSYPYRIEKIVLNKLPKNYDIEDEKSKIDLKARSNLNYVYLLMNNKIWIFQPNTTNYKNTKSLNYLGQIEWDKKQIKDFYVNQDWEIIILNNEWLYKVNFEISDDRILIR